MRAAILIFIGVVMVAYLARLGWSLLRSAAKPLPASDVPVARPLAVPVRPRAFCEYCGRQVAVRKGDGMPYANRHHCHIVRPQVTVEDVAAVRRDFEVVGQALAGVMAEYPVARADLESALQRAVAVEDEEPTA
jgi:hypothetical protein